MYTSEVKLRVRYAETDKMGYCYYGNYAQFFEVGRVEALRNLGFSYKELEASGIILPVLEYQIKYIKPAYYDDILTIQTKISKMPKTRMYFEYETYNEAGELLNIASTTLVFVDEKTGKPTKPPKDLVESIVGYL
ncbi:MAG: acyl-CoA thioester hydrolase [Flavobacteriales bacterium]|jgi:acyl-CoA thioester hydrolase